MAITFRQSLSKTYILFILDCERKTEPNMKLANIIIHDEVKYKLSDGHIDILGKFGITSLKIHS